MLSIHIQALIQERKQKDGKIPSKPYLDSNVHRSTQGDDNQYSQMGLILFCQGLKLQITSNVSHWRRNVIMQLSFGTQAKISTVGCRHSLSHHDSIHLGQR